MSKLIVKIHFFMILLLAIFGNSFLKYKIGISNLFLIVYFFISTIHVLISLKEKFFITQNEKKLIQFIFFMIVSVILSNFEIYKLFDINGIFFERKYILKQIMFLNLLPIGISMGICFCNERTLIKEICERYSFSIFILFWILVIFKLCNNTVSYYLLIIFSFIIVNDERKNYFTKFIIMIFTAIYLKFIYSESTAFIMLLIYLFMVLFNKKVLNILQRRRLIFYFFLIVIGILAYYKRDFIIQYLKVRDANYWWRFTYWISEIRVLAKTGFVGIGYGSTYASVDIFNILRGGFIDPETGVAVNSAKVLFTTAQHNSYMNVLYRLGIIGFVLFIRIIFSLIFKYRKYLRDTYDKTLYLAFLNINVIIIFNVGLESPQFLIPFYMALFGILSLEKKYKYIDIKGEKNE